MFLSRFRELNLYPTNYCILCGLPIDYLIVSALNARAHDTTPKEYTIPVCQNHYFGDEFPRTSPQYRMQLCYNTTQSGSKRLKILADGDEGIMPTRDDAYILMTSHVKNENLQKHMFSVEAAMRFYARKYEEDEEIWAMTGLLHDCDYEKFPDLKEHTLVLAQWLREDGYDERIALFSLP